MTRSRLGALQKLGAETVAAHDRGVNDIVVAVLSVMVFATAFRAALGLAAGSGSKAHRRLPVATVTALVVVGVPTLVQLTNAPALLGHLQRDRAAIGDGQVWRLVTSLVVQDGGWSGTVFNLVGLAVVGVAAERVWGPRRWAIIAVASGVGAQLWGLVVQPLGAGNSVAVFGLAASLAAAAVRSANRATRVSALVCLAAALVLLLAGDIHGGAAAVGGVAGAIMAAIDGRMGQPRGDQP